MARISWDALPPEIQATVDRVNFHKAIKRGSTIIEVQERTFNHVKWKKSGKKWKPLNERRDEESN